MPVISADALRKSIARGDRGGVFFLHGEEDHLKEETARAIADAHLDATTRDFNLDQVRGTSVEPDTLATMAHTPPLLGDWRVIVVRDAQALAQSARARSVLERLAERPVPGLALILIAQLPEKSKAKFYKVLEKRATSLVFDALREDELPDWLMDYAAAAGIELETPAARALAAAAGPGLGRLVQEIAKLADYVGDRKRVSVDDVRNLVGYIPQQNRWDWIDLVGTARFDEARHALVTLLESESGVGILIGLGSHLLRIGVALHGGERTLAGVLPPHQRWLASRIARQATAWTAGSLDAALEDLLRADRLLKSAPLDDRHVLDELLLRLQTRNAA